MLAYATATAMPDPNGICDLPHCSRQRRILNPLSEARDGTTSSWILVRFITTEPQRELLYYQFLLPIKCSLFLLCIKDSFEDTLLLSPWVR